MLSARGSTFTLPKLSHKCCHVIKTAQSPHADLATDHKEDKISVYQHNLSVLEVEVARAMKWRTWAQSKRPPSQESCNEPLLLLISPHLPLPSPPLQPFQLLSFQPSLFYINNLTSFPECRDRKVWNELPRAEPLKTLAEHSAHMLAIWQGMLWLSSILAKRGKGLLSLSLAFQTLRQEGREGRASTHQNGKVVCEILYSKSSV